MDGSEDNHGELGTLFAAARELNSADLGAADRFLSGQVTVGRVYGGQDTVQSAPGRAGPGNGRGRQRHTLRIWASTALGLAAALGGLLVLRPASTGPTPTELPASAAYSVYRSALGDGW